jgi:hypothetical protein
MMPLLRTFEAEAEALRAAAARGDFTGAQGAAERLTSLLPRVLAALPPLEAEQRLRQACEVIAFARRNLCDARQRVAAEISRLDALGQYHARLREEAEAAATHRLKIEG